MRLNALTCVLALLPTMSFAVPKFDTTTLPLPTDRKMDDADKKAIEYIVGLTVHQDATDANQFYYVPKFKAVDYQEGSLSLTTNTEPIASYSQIKDLSDKKTSILTDEYDSINNSVNMWRSALEQARRDNDTTKIANYESYLRSSQNQLDELKRKMDQNTSFLPQTYLKTVNNKIADLFSFAGIPFDIPSNESIDKTNARIREATSTLVSNNGGNITSNITAGFSAEEIEMIKTYKTKYAPTIKLSLLPVEKFTYRSLTELVFGSDGKKNISNGVPVFSRLDGGGEFKGSTINFDLTVSGATAFIRRNGPFILPVAIEAKTMFKLEPFEAKLNCDFSTGWSMNGRADVRDGLIIYNNDVTMKMEGKDFSNGSCNIELVSGDRNSASYAGLKALEEEMQRLQIQRSNMAAQDKRAYWEFVKNDVQNNRHTGANSGFRNVFTSFLTSGWLGGFVSALSAASNFYWHTNIQNVNMLSNVKFTKVIKENGYTTSSIPISTDICYVWNTRIKAYKTCTPEEVKVALPLSDATKNSSGSSACTGTSNAVQCGDKRDQKAPTNPDGDILPGSL